MFAPNLIVSLLAAVFMEGVKAELNSTIVSDYDVPSPNKINCRISAYLDAGVNAIQDGIQYLSSVKGNATLGHQSGGGWCWRYSCSYNAGIFGCNDAQEDVEVPYLGMAHYADLIRKECTFSERHGKAIQGQAFSPDGWNVIVGMKAGTHC